MVFEVTARYPGFAVMYQHMLCNCEWYDYYMTSYSRLMREVLYCIRTKVTVIIRYGEGRANLER